MNQQFMVRNHLKITRTPVKINLDDFMLTGEPVINQTRRLKDLPGFFGDRESLSRLDPETIVYSVQAWMPVAEGTKGGLYFGVSTIMPGRVGQEYFMTKGHFHALSDRGEFYWGVKGNGMLILMDRNRTTWAEEVCPGSLHYIPGEVAHRLANTGNSNLVVGASWPADAGYDYEEIAINGFSARLMEVDGKPQLAD
jgi:glucose-6-phosphate isomerase, archaeal